MLLFHIFDVFNQAPLVANGWRHNTRLWQCNAAVIKNIVCKSPYCMPCVGQSPWESAAHVIMSHLKNVSPCGDVLSDTPFLVVKSSFGKTPPNIYCMNALQGRSPCIPLIASELWSSIWSWSCTVGAAAVGAPKGDGAVWGCGWKQVAWWSEGGRQRRQGGCVASVQGVFFD